jgi:hypothetical protein
LQGLPWSFVELTRHFVQTVFLFVLSSILSAGYRQCRSSAVSINGDNLGMVGGGGGSGTGKGLQTELTVIQVSGFQNDLENIDKAASHLSVPTRHSALLFGIKVHINLIRTRLAARLIELRSQMSKVA